MMTEIRSMLIRGLLAFGVPDGKAALTGLLVRGEDQELELMYYMADNPDLTSDEIVAKAKEIARRAGRDIL